jgi:uncharacterized membrane protein
MSNVANVVVIDIATTGMTTVHNFAIIIIAIVMHVVIVIVMIALIDETKVHFRCRNNRQHSKQKQEQHVPNQNT